MSFDFAWDFRNTLAFVTDPAYAVFEDSQTNYPHTYTNGNGFSINAGKIAGGGSSADRATDIDVRCAGISYTAGTNTDFQIDLSSGSAPGAGSYTVDLSCGDVNQARSYGNNVKVLDTATARISFSGTTGGARHFFDATGTDLNIGTGSWTGTPVSVTFSTTEVHFTYGDPGGFAMANHFRLTLAAAGTSAAPHLFMLLGVGA